MSLVRNSELYVPKSTSVALRTVAEELCDQFSSVDALADHILREQLEARYPGLFAMIEECNDAYSATAEANKKRVEAWKETRKPKP